MHTRLLVGGLLVGGLGAACLREPSFDRCDDGRICASGQVCVEPRATCVPAELAAPCLGQAELAPCTTPSITDGVCDRGLCVEAGCGNGVREAERGELCDDGNTDAGDGCGFDCRSDERCGNGVVDTLTGEQCDDGDLASRDGCSSRCRVETARWHLRPPVPSPVRRFGAGSAVDLTRGRLVLFGGLVGQTLQGDTWEYDGQSWRRAGGVLAPQPRQLPAMSFDRHRREVLLIGGEAAASGLLDDVWAWNGSEWSLVTTFGLAPAPRRGAAMTYDPVRRRHVLVGGNLGGGAGAGGIELWELDEDRVWHARTEAGGPTSWLVAGTPPIGFDPVRGEVVLVVVPDTFTWNGTQWRKVTPARLPWNSSPPLVAVPGTGQLRGFDTSIALLWDGDRWQQAIAPFPTSPVLQAYLGRAGGVIAIDDAWVTRRVPGDPSQAPTLPQPAALASMAYDPLRGELVRFGGLIGGASSSATWIRRGGAWSPRAPAPAPPARNGACLAFDPTSGHVLLFGGFTAASTLAGDTWSWDGSSWTELSPTTGPTPRQLCGMVTHEARRSAILVGGRDATGASAEVWEWTGTWQRLPELPVALAAPATFYDRRRQRLVVFGGQRSDDTVEDRTWEWDGASWAEVPSPSTPPARYGMGAGFHAAGGIGALAGGAAAMPVADAWQWDGTSWAPQANAPQPARRFPASGYDATEAELVVTGGNNVSNQALTDVWGLSYAGPDPVEACDTGLDSDGDGLLACADPDCWPLCTPTCAPGEACDPTVGPRCGDGVCSSLEGCRLCPGDCGACTPGCGDGVCDPGEVCVGDCS